MKLPFQQHGYRDIGHVEDLRIIFVFQRFEGDDSGSAHLTAMLRSLQQDCFLDTRRLHRVDGTCILRKHRVEVFGDGMSRASAQQGIIGPVQDFELLLIPLFAHSYAKAGACPVFYKVLVDAYAIFKEQVFQLQSPVIGDGLPVQAKAIFFGMQFIDGPDDLSAVHQVLVECQLFPFGNLLSRLDDDERLVPGRDYGQAVQRHDAKSIVAAQALDKVVKPVVQGFAVDHYITHRRYSCSRDLVDGVAKLVFQQGFCIGIELLLRLAFAANLDSFEQVHRIDLVLVADDGGRNNYPLALLFSFFGLCYLGHGLDAHATLRIEKTNLGRIVETGSGEDIP